MKPVRAAAPTLAFGAGLALLGAHPPVGAWPLTFVGPALFVAALWVERDLAIADGRAPRVMRLGALAGLTCYGPMLSWLLMPAGATGWVLLVLVQAVWFAVLALLLRPALAHRLFPLYAAVVWTGVDAWRAIWPLNGFEWGAIAYAHVDGSWLLPTARILGGRGITFLVVLIAVAAAAAARAAYHTWRGTHGGGAEHRGDDRSSDDRSGQPTDIAWRFDHSTRTPLALLVGGLLVSALLTIGPPASHGTLDILAVQGNDVRHWEPDAPEDDAPLRIATELRDRTLAEIEADGPPDLTIWPESSIDRDPWTERGQPLAELADEAAEASGQLLTGVSLDGPDPATQRLIAASLFDDGFDESDRYVKRRLVPFGEFIPMRSLLEWFPPLEQIPRDAVPGSGPHRVAVADGVDAAVVICFETMFADVVRTNVLAGDDPAEIVLTLTNDASFGDSGEPAQHLAQSQLRAVETGRWVVHASLSGSSAFIDPDGRRYDDTEVFTVDAIRRDVPLVGGLTPYLRTGDVVGWVTRVLAGAAFALSVVAIQRERATRTGQPGR